MILTKNNVDDVYKCKKMSIETGKLKGYKLIENLFVDNSGFGADNEPAHTQSQFEERLDEIISDNGTVYAFITDSGQFQVYIGLFTKTGKKTSKVIANNTLEIDLSGNDYAIRLHDTDILTYKKGKYILDSGGWRTVTTKERMNRFLPSGYNVFQKDFDWFVNTPKGIVPFIDKMKL